MKKTYDKSFFDGLGDESPTFVLTNDFPERVSSGKVIETYASRNHVEHSLGEKTTFFHLDCLYSEVRLNVDFDLTPTGAQMRYLRLFMDRIFWRPWASPLPLGKWPHATSSSAGTTSNAGAICTALPTTPGS